MVGSVRERDERGLEMFSEEGPNGVPGESLGKRCNVGLFREFCV